MLPTHIHRADFPPTPDTLFPASVDYLFTVSVMLEGETEYTFTLDSTASVNLVTREVADELQRIVNARGGKKAGAGGFAGKKGFGAKEPPKKKKKDDDDDDKDDDGMEQPEEIALEMVLPAEPR